MAKRKRITKRDNQLAQNIGKEIKGQLESLFSDLTKAIVEGQQETGDNTESTDKLVEAIDKLQGSISDSGGGDGQKSGLGSLFGAGSMFSRQQIGYLLSRQNIILGSLLGGIIKTIRDGFSEANALQIRSLSRGFDFKGLIGGKLDDLENLPGGLADALESKMQLLESGLDFNSKTLMEGMIQTRLTGQDSRALANTMRTMGLQGLLSVKAQEDLVRVTLQLKDQYLISSSELVEALDANVAALRVFGILGRGGELLTVQQELTARLGPGAQGLAGELISALTNESSDALRQAALLGVQDARAAFFHDPSLNNLLAVINESAATYSGALGRFTKNSNAPFLMAGVTKDIFGPMGEVSVLIQKEIQSRGDILNANSDLVNSQNKFNESFAAFKAEILDPIKALSLDSFEQFMWAIVKLSNFLDPIKPLLGVLTKFAVVFGSGLLVAKLTASIAGVIGVTFGATLAPILASVTVLFGIFALMKNFFHKAEDNMAKAASDRETLRVERELDRATDVDFGFRTSNHIERMIMDLIANRDREDRIFSLLESGNQEVVSLLGRMVTLQSESVDTLNFR